MRTNRLPRRQGNGASVDSSLLELAPLGGVPCGPREPQPGVEQLREGAPDPVQEGQDVGHGVEGQGPCHVVQVHPHPGGLGAGDGTARVVVPEHVVSGVAFQRPRLLVVPEAALLHAARPPDVLVGHGDAGSAAPLHLPVAAPGQPLSAQHLPALGEPVGVAPVQVLPGRQRGLPLAAAQRQAPVRRVGVQRDLTRVLHQLRSGPRLLRRRRRCRRGLRHLPPPRLAQNRVQFVSGLRRHVLERPRRGGGVDSRRVFALAQAGQRRVAPQEVEVVVGARQLLQLAVPPPQRRYLLPELRLQLLGPTQLSPLLLPDQPDHLGAPFLQQTPQLGEGLLAVPHGLVGRPGHGLRPPSERLGVPLPVPDPLLDLLAARPELRLPGVPLRGGGRRVVAPVVVHGAQVADALAVGAAEDLHHLVVARAHVLLQPRRGVDQRVLLQRRHVVVRLQVPLAVRRQAHQAGLEGLQFGAGAEIAGHVSGSRRAAGGRSGSESRVLQRLQQLRQQGVLPQDGPRHEALPAKGAAGRLVVGGVLVPAAFDAAHAVAVSARDGHRVAEQVQTDGTAQLLSVTLAPAAPHVFSGADRR
ncbi:hypothetical protein EYF80_050384 [Liparis tanakae]|uniref:Uncharacterized protein n=1 Tax=Liparis tanakae TaxID=230148 RepID=A0A4Z2FE72_9TELE|nr:hypothetical protein EYF80_050384 [Liparis tanakae]